MNLQAQIKTPPKPQMRKLVLLLTLTLTAYGFANIGETYRQSCQRYGKPEGRNNDNSVVWFIDNNLAVIASFDDPGGCCDSVVYQRWDRLLSESEIDTFLSFNSNRGDTWDEAPVAEGRAWITRKSRETAACFWGEGDSRTGRKPFVLSIWTQSKHERYSAAEKNNNPDNEIPSINQLPSMDSRANM